MIKFATDETTALVKHMWKSCFEDSDYYMDLYFTHKYKNENTLIYFKDEVAVASLQILSYTFSFFDQEIPVAYLSGVCTLPEYRKMGYASELIEEAHKIIEQRNIPLIILIPEEKWLFQFYNKYGYEQVFQKDGEVIPLKEILDSSSDLNEAYNKFETLFRNKNFCIQKTFDDFKAIVLDFEDTDYSDKTNISGMAKIIDIERLLNVYAADNPYEKFSIKVNFDNSFIIFSIENGESNKIDNNSDFDIQADLRFLCRLLFGYKTDELIEPYKSLFPVQNPVINFMLE